MAVLTRSTILKSNFSDDSSSVSRGDSSVSETTPIIKKASSEHQDHSLYVTPQCLYAVKSGQKNLVILPLDKNVKVGDYLCFCPSQTIISHPRTEKFDNYSTYSKPVGTKVVKVTIYPNFESFFAHENFSTNVPK